MYNKTIEDAITETLAGEPRENALDFVAFLRESGMQFERGGGYWADKVYWLIKHNGEYTCFVLIDGINECGQPWVIWSDDSTADWDSPLDERTKEIAWANVDFCGNCGSCVGGKRKTIFGLEFDNVCRTTFRFDNPDSEAVECVKKLVGVRKLYILDTNGGKL
jgi:hypothetical protein